MGEANEGRRSKGLMASLSLPIEKYPRDLLQRLMFNNNTQQSQNLVSNDEEDSEDLELNLGLSLGGRFGVDKNDKKKLIRSSSIAGTIPLLREEDSTKMKSVSYSNLSRTSSLPTETEEEWRKRKEIQTLRRLVAKRRRSEKQRNSVKVEKEGCSLDEEKREIEGRVGLNLRDYKDQYAEVNTLNSKMVPPFGLLTWAAAARETVLCGGIDLMEKGKVCGFLGGCSSSSSSGLLGFGQPSSQRSVGSQGGSSSGMSELESKTPQGSSGHAEAKSPAGNQMLHDTSNQDPVGSSGTKATENVCRISQGKTENTPKNLNSGEDMPCVFTKGDGPNGRKVNGILYSYGKGEEAKIMCICHGEFHTPAEFVKHAGGSDVTHPLRHIVVNPSTNM